jgi:hypothetical protein
VTDGAEPRPLGEKFKIKESKIKDKRIKDKKMGELK